MFRPLELFIGLRYVRAKRRNHFISFISLVSMLGIAVGVIALITVISVMNGFEKQLRDSILGMAAHATISSISGSIDDWRQVVAAAESDRHVRGAIVRGISPAEEATVTDLAAQLKDTTRKRLVPGEWGIVLGIELARSLEVRAGDKVTVFTSEINVTPVGGVARFKRFTVAGIFSVGFQEYDDGLALIHLEDAERLFQSDGPRGIRLKLDDMFRAWPITRDLASGLGRYYRITTWEQGHANFFRALQMEKVVMFIILSLVIAVAAFNLVSTLVMLVNDKQADIAILRTLGISPRSVTGVFMVQGVIVGTVGILLGVLLGVPLAINIPAIAKWIEHVFGVQILSPDVYYISEVPSDMHWNDVGWIVVIAFAFCLVATLYPAWRASRTLPAEALRYE
jgi:lipoprotein-releasing system permease protein